MQSATWSHGQLDILVAGIPPLHGGALGSLLDQQRGGVAQGGPWQGPRKGAETPGGDASRGGFHSTTSFECFNLG